jgi:hypothetical protein
MIPFQIGEQVRIVDAVASEWRGALGVVTKTVERDGADCEAPIQECAVQFSYGRGWFPAADLVRVVPDNTVRFFRAEVLLRWKDISVDDVAILNGSADELIGFLQERYGFSLRRAATEVSDFLLDVHERSRTVRTSSVKDSARSAGAGKSLKISAA